MTYRLLALALFFATGCAVKKGSVSITNLRCEYLQNPLGVDAERPRLSWELSSGERGKKQSAYQVMVASDSMSLLDDKADLWNSDKIVSSRTNQLTYDGASLPSMRYCYWKVRVWDEQGNPSGWSPVAWWSTGIGQGQWKAEWIGAEPENVPLSKRYYPNYGYRSALSLSATDEKWVIVDLGEQRQIDEVRLYPVSFQGVENDQFPVRFRIDVSSDSSFSRSSTVAEASSSGRRSSETAPHAERFDPVTARYVRLFVTTLSPVDSVHFGFALAELEVLRNGVNLALHRPVTARDLFIQSTWTNWNCFPPRLTDGYFEPNKEHKNYSLEIPPCPLLRKDFTIGKPVKTAFLSISALGLYEARINGEKAGDYVLAPEWTDYHTRVQYQVYDVKRMLKQGANAIGAMLADGWYAGPVFSHPERGTYGFDRRLLAQLDIEFEDGSVQTVASDGTWRISDKGPVRRASIYDGEIYDAGYAQDGWDSAGFDDSGWKAVTVDSSVRVQLNAQMNEPVKVVKEIKPKLVFRAGNGRYIFDMGQNITGWTRLNLPYRPAGKITFRHAEVLNEDSSIYTANLRAAAQTDEYIPAGEREVIYEPRFTYHGFRYVEVDGLTEMPDKDILTGRVVTSSAPQAATFETSSPAINQLWSNILWTQIGNMHSVPTDCPQRDERAGWMGDAQVFAQNAIFNLDMAAFFTKWIRDIGDTQTEEGRFPDYSPQPGVWGSSYNSPGWADAGVIVPWRVYQNYGDTAVLANHFNSMKKFIDFVHARNPDLLWRDATGNKYGDWLNGNTIIAEGFPKKGQVDHHIYATAFFAYSTRILANAARVLKREQDASYYDSLAAAIRKEYIRNFIDEDGKIPGDTQAGYAQALAFDLVPDDLRVNVAANMAEAVKEYDFRISTGIQTTIHLMNELTRNGYNDIAYRLLESHRFPSWLYSVDQGATTIWERWDGYVKGRGFQNPGMNSFNHYAIGVVGEWMYRNILGINNDDAHPGYRHFVVHPRPGGSISEAKGSYHSVAGLISIEWKNSPGFFTLNLGVPANTSATVVLPAGAQITESGKAIEKFSEHAKGDGPYGGGVSLQVESGNYEFRVDY